MKKIVISAIASSLLLMSTPAVATPAEPTETSQQLLAQTERYKLSFEVLHQEGNRYQAQIRLDNLTSEIIWDWGLALTMTDKIESADNADVEHLAGAITHLKPHYPDNNTLAEGHDTITYWATAKEGQKPAAPFAAWLLEDGKTPTSDSDKDGIPDFAETTLKLDPESADTDSDGLTDAQELAMRLNPKSRDTDGNGVEDADEDPDKDGVTTRQELKDVTLARTPDTDFDGLNDGEEKKHRTDPVKADTDGDGVKDGEEVRIGSNPLVAEKTFTVTRSTSGQPTSPSVTINNLTAEQVNSFSVSRLAKDLPRFPTTIPGYLDNPYEFQVKGTFAQAKVSFAVDKKLLTPGVQPALYRFDEKSQRLVRVPGQVFADGKVTATLKHFSTYILLDQKKFDEVWKGKFKEIPDAAKSYDRLDMVFTLDSSGSMGWNDKRNERVQVTKNFIDRLGAKDRAAVVDFDGSATILQGLTKDKAALKSSLGRIDSSGSTDLTAGISTSLAALKDAGGDKTLKTVVFLTDGDGSYDASLTAKAKAQGVRIYTIGLGSGVNSTVLKQIAAGTGGKFFAVDKAEELSEVFTSIADEADLRRDSDGDGLSDYWEKQMRAGKLRLGTGVPLSLMDPNNPDSDGDGLSDGHEVQVKREPGAGVNGETLVYVTMRSNPMKKDSDGDAIPDKMDKAPMVNAPKDQLIFQSASLLGKRKPQGTPTMGETRVALDLTYNDYNLFQMGKTMIKAGRTDYLPVGKAPWDWPGTARGDRKRYENHTKEFMGLMFLGLGRGTSSSLSGNADGAGALGELIGEFLAGGNRGSVTAEQAFDQQNYTVMQSSKLQRAVTRHRNTVKYIDGTAAGITKLLEGQQGELSRFTVGGEQQRSLTSQWLLGKVDNDGNRYEKDKRKRATNPYSKLPAYGDPAPIWNSVFRSQSGWRERLKRVGHLSEDGSLGLAIHAYHGATIELKDYQVNDGEFSGTLEYTFYDHFGLDGDDFVLPAGFPAWFALQHDKRYKERGGKPPVVVVKVRKQISGSL